MAEIEYALKTNLGQIREALNELRNCAVLTPTEALALVEMIDIMTGGNAEGVFAWDGTDSDTDPAIRAFVKVFKAARRNVPEEVK